MVHDEIELLIQRIQKNGGAVRGAVFTIAIGAAKDVNIVRSSAAIFGSIDEQVRGSLSGLLAATAEPGLITEQEDLWIESPWKN